MLSLSQRPEMDVHVSLISHTNTGKTTLARTLLGRDVAEVRDAAHVTQQAEQFVMLESAQGDRLLLWDTPGFGDSGRLLKRLRQSNNPISWFLTQVWDRTVDRGFYFSQKAVKNVRDHANIVLYLVNAADNPQDAAYVNLEMEVLSWVNVPVILLLNQLGPPRPRESELAEITKWRNHTATFSTVVNALSLDAFARCWIQEGTLLRAVTEALPEAQAAAMPRLQERWRATNFDRFSQSMSALARQLALAIVDKELVTEAALTDKLKDAVTRIVKRDEGGSAVQQQAMKHLAQRLDHNIRDATNALVTLHGLEGSAAEQVMQRLRDDYQLREPLDEGKAAVWGGIVSGALAGLAADVAAGGLTFGAGLIGGGLLGALGAGGIAKGYNMMRGDTHSVVRWSPEFVEGLVHSALLRYLAVAHFGRGRGEWSEAEHPRFWQQAVVDAVTPLRSEIQALVTSSKSANDETHMQSQLKAMLESCGVSLLTALYPDDSAWLAAQLNNREDQSGSVPPQAEEQ